MDNNQIIDVAAVAVPIVSEIALRLYPTKKNISIISFIANSVLSILNVFVPNRKKDSDLKHF